MPSKLTGNKPGRPRSTYSRRRFHLAVAALNRVLKQEKQPAHIVVRCAELLCFIFYGGVLPGGVDKRDKREIRELCLEHNLVKQMTAQIDSQMEAERLAEQERQDQEATDHHRQVFDAVLGMYNPGDGDNE